MKNTKSNKNPTVIDEQIVDTDMSVALIGAFNRYAKEVISNRAIPDARDGLKPVQRRIIYSMFSNNQVYSKPTVKCATIVGDIMGHYHPHGDASIYDALVRLSQGWKMEAPLIDFQGNNGSIDDDPAAAFRYTEARLSLLSEYMVKDIEKDTVKMVPTFDDKKLEPVVLPSRFPNLLVNGTNGIAVGSSTYIPPHNLSEVVDATIYRIKHKKCTLDDLTEFIKGPDFPTGGIIDDKQAIRTMYETGHSNFYVYCKTQIDESEHAIVISEIPFDVVKINLVAELTKRKETDKLDNITEIVDESARDDINIVIKIKEDASCEDMLAYLMNKGALRTTIPANFLAIDKGHPKTMPLIQLIDSFIAHQREVSTKSYTYDLKQAENRLEIVEGFLKLVSIIKEVVDKILNCHGKEDVKRMLQNDYGFSERQSEAIATLPLHRLSNTDVEALKTEYEELLKTIAEYKEILSDENKLDKTIIAVLENVRKQFARPRKTEILDEKLSFASVDRKSLIAKEDCMVVISADGYAKRTNLKSFEAAKKLNKDENDPLCLPRIKPGDSLVFNMNCTTHDSILLFTSSGSYAYVPVHVLTDLKWKEEGKHLNNLISLKPQDKIVKAYKLNEFKKGLYVIILSSNNKIKRTELTEFAQTGLTKKPLKATKLGSHDEKVIDVTISSGNSDLIVCDVFGRVSRFNESKVPALYTNASGVKAFNEGTEDLQLISLLSLNSKESTLILAISSRRSVRLFSSNDIPSSTRLGPKTNLIKINKKNPWRFVSLTKAIKIRNEDNYFYVVTEDKNININLNDMKVSDIEVEMRENIDGLDNQEIIAKHNFGEVIDENTLVETPLENKSKSVKVKEDNDDKQLSLFDLYEQEKN